MNAVIQSVLIDPMRHRHGRGFRVMHDMRQDPMLVQLTRMHKVVQHVDFRLQEHSVYFELPVQIPETTKGLILTMVGV